MDMRGYHKAFWYMYRQIWTDLHLQLHKEHGLYTIIKWLVNRVNRNLSPFKLKRNAPAHRSLSLQYIMT